jgi:hypothetical protein
MSICEANELIIFYVLIEKYFFTKCNGFLSEISYFRNFWPPGGSTAVKKLSRVLQKLSTIIYINVFFISGEPSLAARSEKR